MKDLAKNIGDKMWEFIYGLHLYDSKAEGIFKAFIITISWIGGVHMSIVPDEATIPIASSLFLFAISLVMEYTVRLVIVDKIIPRILPLVIVAISVVCAFVSFAELVGRPFGIELDCIYNMTIVPQIVIWFDVLVHLMINKTNSDGIEKNLKKVEVNG